MLKREVYLATIDEHAMEIAEKYDLDISIVGHAGDGNFHPHIAFDMRNIQETERVNAAIKELFPKFDSIVSRSSDNQSIYIN